MWYYWVLNTKVKIFLFHTLSVLDNLITQKKPVCDMNLFHAYLAMFFCSAMSNVLYVPPNTNRPRVCESMWVRYFKQNS